MSIRRGSRKERKECLFEFEGRVRVGTTEPEEAVHLAESAARTKPGFPPMRPTR